MHGTGNAPSRCHGSPMQQHIRSFKMTKCGGLIDLSWPFSALCIPSMRLKIITDEAEKWRWENTRHLSAKKYSYSTKQPSECHIPSLQSRLCGDMKA